MDTETAEAVDTLRVDIRRLDTSVHLLETSLRDEITRSTASLRVEIAQSAESLRGEIARGDESVRDEVRDVKRHMNVIAESLRDDIRMVAEGVIAVGAKVDSLRL